MRARELASAVGLTVILAGCGPATATCVPGRVEPCICAGSVAGVQACRADGTFEACECSVGDAGTTMDATSPADAFSMGDAGGSIDGALLADALGNEDGGAAGGSTTYVIGTMTVPPAPTGGVAPGLDLDGKISVEGGAGNCEDRIGDFTSPEGRTGVDNQLVGAVTSVLRSLGIEFQDGLDRSIASGRHLLALRVRGIESYANDDMVVLDLFLVKQAECATSTCPVVGGVMSGDDWVARGTAISTGTRGAIAAGTLTGSLDTFPLVAVASGETLTFTLENATLIGDISPSAITRGAIGGEVGLDDVVRVTEMIMPGIGDSVRPMLADRADMSPAAADPLTCSAFSAGLGFTAVLGNLVE